MAVSLVSLRIFNNILSFSCRSSFGITRRFLRSVPQAALTNTESKDEPVDNTERDDSHQSFQTLADYRFVYPEFLPEPQFNERHKIKEKLERHDMLKRRSVIDIPEFYVGSVLAVRTSDPFAPGKENRFVGICIARTYFGLKATFTLRNIVDKQGVEIMYDMYNPTIQQIQVLRLEKRLDNELYYLRDAPPEYSTFPFDMEPEFIAEGEPVRVNPLKVKLKPKPWHSKWQLHNLKGVEPFDEHLDKKEVEIAQKLQKPWEKYDLMKQYRKSIPEEDQKEIWEEVDEHRKLFQQSKQKWKQRILLKAPKLKKNY